MKKLVISSALLLTMIQANVSIQSASFQEKTQVTQSGEKVKAWVKASKVVPGTVIRYVNSLENAGSRTAKKLVVKNPIPENMTYVANSASCQSSCSISYSVDGGKSYKKSEALYIGVGENRHLAKASEYTDIMWVLNSLEQRSESTVEYKAQLK